MAAFKMQQQRQRQNAMVAVTETYGLPCLKYLLSDHHRKGCNPYFRENQPVYKDTGVQLYNNTNHHSRSELQLHLAT